MLEVKELFLHAGNFSLKDICLSVGEGSCHVVLGPTGSGKTLLLEAIMGFRKIERGRIFHAGKDITRLPPERREISYLPQDLALFPKMNVKENILYGIRVRKVEDETHQRLFRDLVNILGIEHLLERRIERLSGGERQRVALARAIVTGNRTLLLDEPLSALHESMRRDLWMLIKDLQKSFHLNILMVTHDVEEAFFLADRVSVIYDGLVLQSSDKEDFFHELRDVRVAGLVGVRNIFEAELLESSGAGSRFFSKELNTVVKARNHRPLLSGTRFFLGVHGSDMDVRTHPIEGFNSLEVEILRVYRKVRSVTIEVKTPSGKILTIEKPSRMYRFLNEGHKAFAVFSPDDVLVMDHPGDSIQTTSP